MTDLVGWLAEKTGQHAGAVTSQALHWLIDLEAAGFTASEAQAVVIKDGEAIKSADRRADPVAMLADCVRARIDQRRMPLP